jgi:hypothetical protein
MGKLEKIENEIQGLDHAELAALRKWFREFDAEAWDREIELDAAAGKLDRLAQVALKGHRAGKSKPL